MKTNFSGQEHRLRFILSAATIILIFIWSHQARCQHDSVKNIKFIIVTPPVTAVPGPIGSVAIHDSIIITVLDSLRICEAVMRIKLSEGLREVESLRLESQKLRTDVKQTLRDQYKRGEYFSGNLRAVEIPVILLSTFIQVRRLLMQLR